MKRAVSALELAVFSTLVLGAGAFVVAARARTNWDQDIWWHLRAGQWIVEHGALPATDPFYNLGRAKAGSRTAGSSRSSGRPHMHGLA